MKSFWSLGTIDKCAALACLVQTLAKAKLTSLQLLAEARGESVEEVWAGCCREAGVEPCTVPYHLFGNPDGARARHPAANPQDTPGFAARAKLLAELGRSRAFRTRDLHAHAERPR